MAIFGDLGKAFGLGTAGETARDVAQFFGVKSQRNLDVIERSAQAGSDFISGGEDVDVSSRPAGVDSPATVSPLSQTSMLIDGPGKFGRGFKSTMPVSRAFIGGGFIPGVIGGVGRALSRLPSGGLVGAAGTLLAADTFIDIFGNEKKLVITRKLQRDVKKVFMMSGGDITFVAQNSGMLFAKNLSEDQILMILFKTFKNQGPYVTKAAVRKTRQTIRKMETLCDLKDRLAPPKPARRRAPARRMSTSITQVK